MYIVGRRPVMEALRSNRQISEVLIRGGSHGSIVFDIKNIADKKCAGPVLRVQADAEIRYVISG